MSLLLKDKVFIITGATGGIGSEITKCLSADNEVIACGRDEKLLDLLKTGFGVKTVVCDVTKEESIKELFLSIKDLDVLINCAAILYPVEKFGNCSLKDWKKNIEVNLVGTANMIHYALPFLLKSKRGKIINFSGGGGAYGRENHTAYASSKCAVVRFSESLAMEYPELDINSIAPGAYKTNMWKDEKHDKEPDTWGDMNRLKDFFKYLCSDKSDGITGKFIHYKDNWESFGKNTLAKDMFTLRRVEK